MSYRFELEKYHGLKSRYICPQCGQKHRFTRYVDMQSGQHLAEHVGRCDREVRCGYHYTPKQYFADHPTPNFTPPPPQAPMAYRPKQAAPTISTHTMAELQETLRDYEDNHLVSFLNKRLGQQATRALLQRYRVGTSHYWDSSTVFWQVDAQQRVRAGKVMVYYPHTGKRIKTPKNYITWMHKVLRKEGFELRQCLFGEHLLAQSIRQPVAIVESEKTALIASHFLRGYLWMATGSISNLTPDKCRVLQGRKVILYPDAGAYTQWEAVGANIPQCTVSPFLEQRCNPQQRSMGWDLADHLLAA